MSSQRLRAKGFRADDVVFGTLKKARNPRFHSLVHAFGALCVENIEDFTGMNAHEVLKRIQYEANIGCEEFKVILANGMEGVVRWPRSLSFAEMDESEFQEIYRAMCNYIAERYWPDLDADGISDMAEIMGDVA